MLGLNFRQGGCGPLADKKTFEMSGNLAKVNLSVLKIEANNVKFVESQ